MIMVRVSPNCTACRFDKHGLTVLNLGDMKEGLVAEVQTVLSRFLH